MKKIGILSVRTINYGSILQSYALQYAVGKIDKNNEIINYQKTNIIRQLVRLLYLPLFFDSYVKVKDMLYKRIFRPDLIAFETKKNKAFQRFINSFLIYGQSFKGRTRLIRGTKETYRMVILGSDQVWHPFNYGAHFFDMSFIPSSVKKIAYAPSFGVSTLPAYQRRHMAKCIENIDYLSVRENSGRDLIKKLTGREAVVVTDPTLLLTKEEWNKVKAQRMIEEKYIFCYFLGKNINHRAFANKLSERTGYKIVTLPHNCGIIKADWNFGDIIPEGVGPAEFVSLIANAEYVCTDSFHGSVFSIIFERDWFTFPRFEESKMSTNSRILSLFQNLGVKDRFIPSDAQITPDMLEDMDFSEITKRLTAFRAESFKFLKESIEA